MFMFNLWNCSAQQEQQAITTDTTYISGSHELGDGVGAVMDEAPESNVLIYNNLHIDSLFIDSMKNRPALSYSRNLDSLIKV